MINHHRCHLPQASGLWLGGILLCMALLAGREAIAMPAVCVASEHPDLSDCPAIEQLLEPAEPPPGVVFDVIENNPAALTLLQATLIEVVAELQNKQPQLVIEIVSHGNELAPFAAPQGQASAFLDWSAAQGVDVVGCRYYAAMREMDSAGLETHIQMVDSATDYLESRAGAGFAIIRLRPKPAAAEQYWLEP